MSDAGDTTDPLAFPPPSSPPIGDWLAAERESFKFAGRFLKKARELKDARDQLSQAWDENNQLRGRLENFIIRNLIAIADNCRPGLGVASSPDASEQPVQSTEAVCLASVYRSVLYVLEELGATPVPLIGHTYRDVSVDGQIIVDPFEVVESEQKGKTDEILVREVVHELWILRRGGQFEVLRRGKVNC